MIPDELSSNIVQKASNVVVQTEESFETLPSLEKRDIKDLQERDSVVGKFIELWNTKQKPSRPEQR